MSNLDLVEAASGGPFKIAHHGQTYTLVDPASISFQTVLALLDHGVYPDLPRPMARWKQELVLQRWSAHYDLPDFTSAQRLAYVIDRYRSALVYDLQVHAATDLGALWRARRWRTLLDLIDHLPTHSWYSSAVATDEEHAEMIRKSMAAREADGERLPTGPPMHTWTPEVAAITLTTDAIRSLEYTLAAINGAKGDRPPPLPRPTSALASALNGSSHERRKAKHEALADRILARRQKKADSER